MYCSYSWTIRVFLCIDSAVWTPEQLFGYGSVKDSAYFCPGCIAGVDVCGWIQNRASVFVNRQQPAQQFVFFYLTLIIRNDASHVCSCLACSFLNGVRLGAWTACGLGGLIKKKVVVADDGCVSILILTNTPRLQIPNDESNRLKSHVSIAFVSILK